MDYKADFHIHSRYSSDGSMPVKSIFELALKKGLGAVAIADHNVFDGSYEALSAERGDLTVIPAVEVSTTKGHMLCYFVSKGPGDAGVKKHNGLFLFDEVRAYVNQEKGLMFAAHPYRNKILKIESVLDKLDGIEVFNGRNTSRNQTANDFARLLATERNLCFTAGSDAHLPGEIGRACRIFNFDSLPQKHEIYEAMLSKQGAYYGSYSPLVYEGISGLKHAMRIKNGKRIAKDIFKIILGGIMDPLAAVRPGVSELRGGRIYHMPDSSGSETGIR